MIAYQDTFNSEQDGIPSFFGKTSPKKKQRRTASSRALELRNYKHLYRYQNGELIRLSSKKADLQYTYDKAGLFTEKKEPLSHRKTSYNRSGLPEFVDSPIGDERLLWDRSGKLSLYKSREEEKSFSYTPIGYLQSAGNLDYTFDFGGKGTGVRTEPLTHSVESLDELGRVYSEGIRNTSAKVYYDEAGQVTFQNGKDFTWDVWGRFVKVEESGTTFQISYDGFGRRIQTIYTPYSGSAQTSYHFYDPEEEFGEIGISSYAGTFWRFNGPDGCDAVFDDNKALYLNNDVLRHSYDISFSSYGPTKTAPIHNLISYAQMLSWHSRSMDPIGLI